jgi:hypothetical protein
MGDEIFNPHSESTNHRGFVQCNYPKLGKQLLHHTLLLIYSSSNSGFELFLRLTSDNLLDIICVTLNKF